MKGQTDSAEGNSIVNANEPKDSQIKQVSEWLERSPKDSRLWAYKGSCLEESGRFEEAIECYNRAIQLKPKEARYQNLKGYALAELGRFDEAVECYDRAIQLKPKEAVFWAMKGHTLKKWGRYEEAIACYRRAIQLKPKDPFAWLSIGCNLTDLGGYEEAIVCWDKIIQHGPPKELKKYDKVWRADALKGKGLALKNLERYEESIACFEKAIQLNPKEEDAKKALVEAKQALQEQEKKITQEAAEKEASSLRLSGENMIEGKPTPSPESRILEDSGPEAIVSPVIPVLESKPDIAKTPVSLFPQELGEYYTEIKPIGSGGFARVFRARRKSDGTEVAVKIPLFADAQTGKSFVREITSWQNLNHRNIVKLYDLNILPIPYLEMELCDGNLEGLPKPLEIERAARLIFDIAEGLKYAHSKEIIHRDLKPANVLLHDGVPKIADWGLSKIAKDSRGSMHSSFTILYASPEQLAPDKFGKTDNRTDIYQLGTIFYELTTGEPPFQSDSVTEVMAQILMAQPKPPSDKNYEVKVVEPIIMKCLEKEMSQRYQTADHLQKDLAEYLKIEYRESLRKSRGDMKRSGYYCSELCMMHLQRDDVAEALKYAMDLKNYAAGDAKVLLTQLIDELEYRCKEGISAPEELIERADVVLHQIKMGW